MASRFGCPVQTSKLTAPLASRRLRKKARLYALNPTTAWPEWTRTNVQGRIYDSEGRGSDYAVDVIPLKDLVTSHRDDFRADPRFPPVFQARDRAGDDSRIDVSRMARELDVERLAQTGAAATEGAPVVWISKGLALVLAGNGRVMALRQASKTKQKKYLDLVEHLTGRRGVLVRRLKATRQGAVAFAAASQRSSSADETPLERARAMLRSLSISGYGELPELDVEVLKGATLGGDEARLARFEDRNKTFVSKVAYPRGRPADWRGRAERYALIFLALLPENARETIEALGLKGEALFFGLAPYVAAIASRASRGDLAVSHVGSGEIRDLSYLNPIPRLERVAPLMRQFRGKPLGAIQAGLVRIIETPPLPGLEHTDPLNGIDAPDIGWLLGLMQAAAVTDPAKRGAQIGRRLIEQIAIEREEAGSGFAAFGFDPDEMAHVRRIFASRRGSDAKAAKSAERLGEILDRARRRQRNPFPVLMVGNPLPALMVGNPPKKANRRRWAGFPSGPLASVRWAWESPTRRKVLFRGIYHVLGLFTGLVAVKVEGAVRSRPKADLEEVAQAVLGAIHKQLDKNPAALETGDAAVSWSKATKTRKRRGANRNPLRMDDDLSLLFESLAANPGDLKLRLLVRHRMRRSGVEVQLPLPCRETVWRHFFEPAVRREYRAFEAALMAYFGSEDAAWLQERKIREVNGDEPDEGYGVRYTERGKEALIAQGCAQVVVLVFEQLYGAPVSHYGVLCKLLERKPDASYGSPYLETKIWSRALKSWLRSLGCKASIRSSRGTGYGTATVAVREKDGAWNGALLGMAVPSARWGDDLFNWNHGFVIGGDPYADYHTIGGLSIAADLELTLAAVLRDSIRRAGGVAMSLVSGGGKWRWNSAYCDEIDRFLEEQRAARRVHRRLSSSPRTPPPKTTPKATPKATSKATPKTASRESPPAEDFQLEMFGRGRGKGQQFKLWSERNPRGVPRGAILIADIPAIQRRHPSFSRAMKAMEARYGSRPTHAIPVKAPGDSPILAGIGELERLDYTAADSADEPELISWWHEAGDRGDGERRGRPQILAWDSIGKHIIIAQPRGSRAEFTPRGIVG